MLWYCTTLFCSVRVRTFYPKYVLGTYYFPQERTEYVLSNTVRTRYVLSTEIMIKVQIFRVAYQYVLVRTGTYRVHTYLLILVPHFSYF